MLLRLSLQIRIDRICRSCLPCASASQPPFKKTFSRTFDDIDSNSTIDLPSFFKSIVVPLETLSVQGLSGNSLEFSSRLCLIQKRFNFTRLQEASTQRLSWVFLVDLDSAVSTCKAHTTSCSTRLDVVVLLLSPQECPFGARPPDSLRTPSQSTKRRYAVIL